MLNLIEILDSVKIHKLNKKYQIRKRKVAERSRKLEKIERKFREKKENSYYFEFMNHRDYLPYTLS